MFRRIKNKDIYRFYFIFLLGYSRSGHCARRYGWHFNVGNRQAEPDTISCLKRY
ncbi:hypothetical protein [Bacteroides stercorirosoris]|uniref:hypothetical protein n=1 Tax=Bacteroides stercorirosoris TaxID=871324 RepID=UPI001FB05348|nr:hypothetical protein [Bacteroides stercorirosoris]